MAFLLAGVLAALAVLLTPLAAAKYGGGAGLSAPSGRGAGAPVSQCGGSRFACLLIAAFIAGGIYCAHELEREDPLAKYAVSPYNNAGERQGGGDMPMLSGRVLKVREKDECYRSLTVRSGGRNMLVNVSGEWHSPADVIGREISFSGTVELPQGRRNPSTFDYALYLKTQGVRVIVKCGAAGATLAERQPRNMVWDAYGAVCRLKYDFLARAKALMPKEEYGIFAGMMFGGSSEMDDESYEMFRRNGVAHILSVSGLHVAIVYAFFTLLLGRRRTSAVYIAIAAALVCYAAMSEFSPSVVRAVTMISLHLVSKIIRARYDLLTGTCAAALFMLLVSPLDLMGVGFKLSFLAVLLLAFGIPFTERYIGYRDAATGKPLHDRAVASRFSIGGSESPELIVPLRKKAVEIMVPLLVIQLGMAPMIAYEFNYVSLSGLIVNPPVVAIAGWVLPVGICMFACCALPLPDFLFGLAAQGETVMTGLISWLVRAADAIPYGHFNVPSPPVPLLFAFYGMLFLLLSESGVILRARFGRGRVTAACVCIALAAAVSFASPLCRQDRSAFVFVDVGQGDCLHIRTPDGRNYLVDGGGGADYNIGKKTLLPYLLKNGVIRLDGVFATHLHMDHWKGLCELSEEMDIGKVYIYEGSAYNPERMKIKASESDFVFIAQGDRVTLGDGVRLDTLWPPRRPDDEYRSMAAEEAAGGGDENRNSLVMKVDYEGVTAMMTGDTGEEAEKTLLEEYTAEAPALHSRILKVGHHGSKYSTTAEFLAAVDPDAAVIQVGRNNFGHPTPDVLDKLAANGIMIFRNDLGGSVMFTVRGGKVIDAKDCKTRFQNN
ncbi:MAG: DNA internalization-related competence protein ComEC/Rec2 [Clostridiales Family XIII bacterium]|nr:DNA internalization-related competence protein ComEC/Rec2 [Clostridiales Family XIII bacterium]